MNGALLTRVRDGLIHSHVVLVILITQIHILAWIVFSGLWLDDSIVVLQLRNQIYLIATVIIMISREVNLIKGNQSI